MAKQNSRSMPNVATVDYTLWTSTATSWNPELVSQVITEGMSKKIEHALSKPGREKSRLSAFQTPVTAATMSQCYE